MPGLKIAKSDEPAALRLLTALVRNWDSLPVATQGLLISTAVGLRKGEPVDRATLMSFITLHKRAGR